MNEKVGATVTHIYESFLLRDLAYIFGGSLILGCVFYAAEGNIIPAINYVTQNILKFMLYAFLSYNCGLIAHNGISLFVGLFKKKTDKKSDDMNMCWSSLMDSIEKYCENIVIRTIERLLFLRIMSEVIYSSSIICVLIFLPLTIFNFKLINLILLGVFAILFMIGLFEQKRRADILTKELLALRNLTKEHKQKDKR